MTYDDLVQISLQLPEVEEGMSYGTPSVKRKGRYMFGLKKDGENVSVKLDWDTRDRLLAELPDIFYITPHYYGYPACLVRFELLDEAQATAFIKASWENAPAAAKMRKGVQ